LRAAQDREHGVAVGGVDVGVCLLLLCGGCRIERPKLGRDRPEHPEDEGGKAQCEHDEKQRDEPQLADASPLRRTWLSPEPQQSAG